MHVCTRLFSAYINEIHKLYICIYWRTCTVPLDLWPRVEQRKWILAKSLKQKQNKNIITKKTNRQEESPEETRKKKKNCGKCRFWLFFVFFVFFLFFPWFWFSSLFFLFALVFFVKPYILCVVGLITLDENPSFAGRILTWSAIWIGYYHEFIDGKSIIVP